MKFKPERGNPGRPQTKKPRWVLPLRICQILLGLGVAACTAYSESPNDSSRRILLTSKTSNRSLHRSMELRPNRGLPPLPGALDRLHRRPICWRYTRSFQPCRALLCHARR